MQNCAETNLFSAIKDLFCLKKRQWNRRFNLWKCAINGCVCKQPEWILSILCTFMKVQMTFERILAPFIPIWPFFEPIFDPIWGCVGSFWGHFGTKIGACWSNFGWVLTIFLGPSEVILTSFWHHFGVVLTPFWAFLGHFGPFLGSFRITFGAFLRSFWYFQWCFEKLTATLSKNNERKGKNDANFC